MEFGKAETGTFGANKQLDRKQGAASKSVLRQPGRIHLFPSAQMKQ